MPHISWWGYGEADGGEKRHMEGLKIEQGRVMLHPDFDQPTCSMSPGFNNTEIPKSMALSVAEEE